MIRYLILLLFLFVHTALTNNEEFINANNLFASSFYNQIRKEKKDNFLISPYSVAALLAFLQSGCKDGTAREIRNTLYLPNDLDKIELLTKKSLIDSFTLHAVNKIYIKDKLAIKDSFKRAATEVYHGQVENINFVPPEEAAKKMNEWVETETNHKIKNLINPDNLNDAVSILMNAVYFKANWTYRFAEANTRKRDFYKSKEDVVQIDTMHLFEEWFGYYENPKLDAQFLEMSFQDVDASMIIALPNEKDGLAALENEIEEVFASQEFESRYFNIELPKFKIESKLQLVNTLKNVGIKKIFNANEADLSGIAGNKGDLVVSDALQQTYIYVEEAGVEAAASTSLGMVLLTLPSSPKKFVVDHPFIFYIKAKGFIVFAGRYVGPL